MTWSQTNAFSQLCQTFNANNASNTTRISENSIPLRLENVFETNSGTNLLILKEGNSHTLHLNLCLLVSINHRRIWVGKGWIGRRYCNCQFNQFSLSNMRLQQMYYECRYITLVDLRWQSGKRTRLQRYR